jgi:hypothetical protein
VSVDPFPLGTLVYLYVGSADVTADLAWYDEAMGGDLMWRFNAYGADVAAVRIGAGPLVLLADHRPVPSCLPIWSVRSLAASIEWLRATGWWETAVQVGVPDGPCVVLRDPSGNEVALLQQDRPDAMQQAYDASTRPH